MEREIKVWVSQEFYKKLDRTSSAVQLIDGTTSGESLFNALIILYLLLMYIRLEIFSLQT